MVDGYTRTAVIAMYPLPLRGGQGHGFILSTLLSRRHRLGARNARLTAKLAVTASLAFSSALLKLRFAMELLEVRLSENFERMLGP